MHKRILLAAFLAAAAVVCPARATLTSTCSSATLTGNGATTAFTFSCKFLQASDISVTVAGVPKSQPTDYTVSGAGNATGTITFTTAPANGAAVVITRTVDYKQGASLRSNRNYDPGTVENALDKAAMQSQQLQNLYTNPPASVLPSNTVAKLNNIRMADQFGSIQAAITDAGTTGAVIIPPSYVGSDTFTNPNRIPVLDLRNGAAAYIGSFSVKAFGASGNNSDDDAGKIQSTINAAVAANNGRVYLPCGTYKINSALSFTPTYFGLTIEGDSANCVTIKAGAAMTTMLSFTDVSQNGRFYFRNITIDGNALASNGIKSTKISYSRLERVSVTGTSVAGVYMDAGWDNVIAGSESHDNTGDGFVISSAATSGNDVTLQNTLASNNSGFGIRFLGGGPFAVVGGAYQANAKGGIYILAYGRPAVIDRVYFEANSATGFVFTTPSKTVKADIIVNGTGVDTTMSYSFPSPHVTIRNCLSNATNLEAFVYLIAASSAVIEGNYNAGPSVPLLKTYGDSTYANPQNVAIRTNSGFSKNIDVDSITTARPMSFSTWSGDSMNRINYFPRNVYSLSRVISSSGTTVWKRGATKYQGNEAFDLDQGASDTIGVNLDTTVNTELANQLIYISAWAKVSTTANGAGYRVAVGAKFSSASVAPDTAWHHIEIADFAPAAGIVAVGISKIGATAGDVISFSRVTVSIVGAPDREFGRDLLPPVWSTTAAPTVGTWAQGDVVWNSTPAAAGVPGWVCTTGGTPGTFKAMAALAP